MLESNEYRNGYNEWDGYGSHGIFEGGFYEGYCYGRRISETRITFTYYKSYLNGMKKPDGDKLEPLTEELMEELERFLQKYGNLSPEKMGQKLIRESEYLILLQFKND